MLEIDGDINEFSAKMPLFKYNFEWKIFILGVLLSNQNNNKNNKYDLIIKYIILYYFF